MTCIMAIPECPRIGAGSVPVKQTSLTTRVRRLILVTLTNDMNRNHPLLDTRDAARGANKPPFWPFIPKTAWPVCAICGCATRLPDNEPGPLPLFQPPWFKTAPRCSPSRRERATRPERDVTIITQNARHFTPQTPAGRYCKRRDTQRGATRHGSAPLAAFRSNEARSSGVAACRIPQSPPTIAIS